MELCRAWGSGHGCAAAATRLDLTGEAGNDAAGVWIEAQGSAPALDELESLLRHAPPPARVVAVEEEEPATPDHPLDRGFRIAPSRLGGAGGSRARTRSRALSRVPPRTARRA